MNPMLKMLMPLVEKNLTDDKVAELMQGILDGYPVAAGGDKNVVVLSLKEGRTYASVATTRGGEIMMFHAQAPLVELVKNAIKNYES